MLELTRLPGRVAALVLSLICGWAHAGDDVSAAGAQPELAPLQHERVDGLWCGTGLLHEFSLRLTQHYQDLQGTLSRKERVRHIQARMVGRTLYTQATKVGSLVLEVTGDELRIVGGEGRLALVRGMAFKRAASDRCGG